MTLVVALASPPHPEGRAAGRCSLALLRGLAAHGVELRAVAAGWPGTERLVPPPDVAVEVVPVPPEVGGGWRDRAHRLRRPRSHAGDGPFGARVRELAREADLLHLDEIDSLWAGVGVAAPAQLHVHYRVRQDRSFRSDRARGQLLEFTLAERQAVRRMPRLVATSPEVAADLRASGAAHVELVRMPIDPEEYEASALEAPRAGMIGTAGWAPTDAAVAMLFRVWPCIRARVPEAELVVAGRGMRPEAPASGAVIVGEVPSAAAFLSRLGVLLYPVPRGSGVKVKVLEALASGVPVVTTPCGAEGVAPSDGLIVAGDGQRFVEVAAELLADPGARRERGAAGRAAIEAHHAPRPATEWLAERLTR